MVLTEPGQALDMAVLEVHAAAVKPVAGRSRTCRSPRACMVAGRMYRSINQFERLLHFGEQSVVLAREYGDELERGEDHDELHAVSPGFE